MGRPLTKEEFVKLVGAGFDVPFTGLVFGQTVLAKLPPGFTPGKFKTETGYVFYAVLGPMELEKARPMWTYYKQNYANGVWVLFRENSNSFGAYKSGAGWHRTLALFDRKYKGESMPTMKSPSKWPSRG